MSAPKTKATSTSKMLAWAFGIIGVFLGVAYWQKFWPFSKTATTKPAVANSTTNTTNATATGPFDGESDGITYAAIGTDGILKKGVKDEKVKDMKTLINVVRASVTPAQKPIPVNEYFGQVGMEALQYATSADKKGADTQSISEISLIDLALEKASANKLKPL